MIIKSKKSEFDHFSALASEWWVENGKFKTLHNIQPVRIKYIQDVLDKKKFNNLKILDLGCGGGLVSEGLYELGAKVTGIDFVDENIRVAKIHAEQKKFKIDYIVKDFETKNINSKFDVIVIFEVLEHLVDWQKFIKKIKFNLKKDGVLIISTINRNLFSKFLVIDLAENLFNLIPPDTHNYHKFIKPKELEFFLLNNSFRNINFKGLVYDPFKLNWKLSHNIKANYFCSSTLS